MRLWRLYAVGMLRQGRPFHRLNTTLPSQPLNWVRMAQSNADQGPEVVPAGSDLRAAAVLGRRVAEAALRWLPPLGQKPDSALAKADA